MHGTRYGSSRPCWEHPADVAKSVARVPGLTSAEIGYMEAVAWGHDLIEDGVTETGERVSVTTLHEAGVPIKVIASIKLLSKEKGKYDEYETALRNAPTAVRIVKCLDRIANLTEARTTFPEERWTRYVRETKEFVLPLAESITSPSGAWLVKQLEALIA